MFRPNKVVLTSLAVFMIATLTACNLGQAAEPTATAFSIDSIKTDVASTVEAQLTASAPTITLTFQASETPSETATSAIATNTQGIPVEETSAITPTASETLLFGFTATPSFTPIGGATTIPSFTPIAVGGGTGGGSTGPVCLAASFQGDITINDDTEMQPWEKFQKIWSFTNTGTCTWDEGFYFASTQDNAPSMGKKQGPFKIKTEDRFVDPGQAANPYIDMYAPGEPGRYVAHWHWFDDKGQPFGPDVTVVICVGPCPAQ
jgi:hypothetical protein